ncbi:MULTISPECIES: preprotein translocase subunit SecY [Mycobacteriales]|uniref:Protein translocase subunit SecY n=1 Tax=Gordonia rubripertincta TaxID=36822 RepID=A0ABT4N2C0_GORRU|nr:MULTISPECIES: preprotein translocase subunit SecY [Mycobacteriales]MBA4025462.1 preprotein translocase subunit SecY [Gordonia sp. (in: high G+C Gram-positive bacteria)]MCZ4553424.1 preprotein translocase subunit SecY [Gordonia rubripertincta]ORM25217.1 preprotein translocase subunit SecY [Williamsia sp. 1135]OZG30000.1 preprotein translocase subunit SecY [Williamsia sp. 1138]
MRSAVISAFRTPDLRRKILFVLGIIILYRLGATIPSPGVDYQQVQQCLDDVSRGDSAGIYSLINMFSGGALLQLSVFAIGIMPYITASIIVQLLTVVIPRFEQLRKEGQSGQAKMTQYTRYLTVALALLQSTGIVALADRGDLLRDCQNGDQILRDQSIFGLFIIVLVMTAGACVVMWFGELITERGIGNGMSLMIFAGIAARIPSEGKTILDTRGGLVFFLVILAALAIVAGVVFIEQGQRRIPVQYAKRMVGRKMYGGSSTYLPLKVNQAGVIPVIFASSLLYLPNLILQLTQSQTEEPSWWQRAIQTYLVDPSNPVYILIYFLMIIFFTYFYVAVTFNPQERADEMKKYGGFIPGIRPGQPTADYLGYVLSRITLPGSIYLGTIAVLPNLFLEIGNSGGVQNIPFGGTAVLIMVGVGLDTVKQVNSQLMQRKYEGFLK